MRLKNWKFKGWAVCGLGLMCFAAGAVIAGGLVHAEQVQADNARVFELRVYHAVPGKMPELEARFRDTTSKLLAKHELNVVGYWVADDSPAFGNTFIWVVAHGSREEAKKNYGAMFADPAFQEMVKSEQANKLVEKVETTFMRPTDFSPLK